MMRGRIAALPGLFAVALLPVLNITLYGTGTIYYGNVSEFDTGYAALLPVFLAAAVGAASILAAVGLAFGKASRRVYLSTLFAVGVLLWAQGAFLMRDYGVFDGRGIDWNAFGSGSHFDLLVWGLIIVAAVIFARKLSQVALAGSLVLILAQGTLFARAAVISGSDAWSKDQESREALPEEIFAYSRTGNIVHIVMDNFQSDVFLELVGEQALEEEFDGFIIFRENIAVALYTALAMPAVFSGQVYDGSVSPDDYYRRAMEEGFHNILLDHGYTVNLMPLMSMRQGGYTHYFRVPDIYDGTARDTIRKEAAHLVDISIFRQVPHIARTWVYNGNNWRLTMRFADPDFVKAIQQRRFFADYIANLRVEGDTPSYHFMHLWPPHPPFTTTASGDYAGEVLSITRENYINEARPVLLLFVDLLRKLKQLGLYDDAMIILHSDHGGGFEPDFMPRRLLGLMAVKPRHSREPMRISDAPTTTADVAGTILESENIDGHDFGRSMLALGPDQTRQRRYVYIAGSDSRMLRGGVVEGSVYSSESHRAFSPVAIERQKRPYQYGEIINLGLVGGGGAYLERGWSRQDDNLVWNRERDPVLVVPVTPPTGDLLLTIEFIPHVHSEKLPRQRIEVSVNGRPTAYWVAEEQRVHRFEARIPQEWIDGTELEIGFGLPDAASPARMGTGADARLLGMALLRFVLDELTQDSGS